MKAKTVLTLLWIAVSMLMFSITIAVAGDDLLGPYENGERDFKRYEIGKIISYFHQRMIGDALVENDFINYQFDKDTEELRDKKMHWRTDLPEQITPKITKEQAESLAEGEILSSRLYIISPESDVFLLDTVPDNPCWVVRSIGDTGMIVTVIDAVTGEFLGYGVPPPYEGFSLSGPQKWDPCLYTWTTHYQNAETWFETMGYDTATAVWPIQSTVQSYIQNMDIVMFYELAHGGSTSFCSGCSGGTSCEATTASEVETWLTDYLKMPFTFVGSCGGLCDTGDNTLSYEFRKGSFSDTATVGYCHMDSTSNPDCELCWGQSVNWQTKLFTYMNAGDSVYTAYNKAMADYPMCQDATYGHCMRFAGDSSFKVKPVVKRYNTDLVVESIETVPAAPNPGQTVNVYVTVKNLGPGDATRFYIEWYSHLTSPPTTFQGGDRWESVTYLAANATHTMSTTFVYSSTEKYNMYAQVDSWEEVPETNEYNNIAGPISILVGPCECDLNHDGACNILDWPYFIEDWGRSDCPVFAPAPTVAEKVAPNNNPSGYPDEKPMDGPPVFREWKVENALPDGDQPVITSSKTGKKKKAALITDLDRASKAPAVLKTASSRLDGLSPTDRENALLQLELGGDVDMAEINMVENVEALWNSGKFDEAIESLQALEDGGVAVAAGISWNAPKVLEEPEWWQGNDVRIGDRERIIESNLDFDAQTGNLFVVLRTNNTWTVNFSSNGGVTWVETYIWAGAVIDTGASVVSNDLYVGYADGADNDTARIRRFSVSNGNVDRVYGWKTVFNSSGDPIKEIALCSNADSWDNRIYYTAILTNFFQLKFCYADQNGYSWNAINTGVSGAWKGLDATWNEGYNTGSGWGLYISFVGYVIEGAEVVNPLHVWRWNFSSSDLILVESDPYYDTLTGISAYDDTVITTFEYRDASNNPGIKYWISHDGGDSWAYGWIAPPTAGKHFWNPDVAARKGGGIAVVYQEEVGEPDTCWYRYRNYSGSIWWTSPEKYNEIDVITGSAMELEYLPPLPGSSYGYGSIWESWDPMSYTGLTQKAYFNRSDGNVCECDLNGDGSCNILDWPYFIEDWGRTDCP